MLAVLTGIVAVVHYNQAIPEAISTPTPATPSPTIISPSPSSTPTPSPISQLQEPILQAPIDQFFERIKYKKFGTSITPATSPIQPEKFTGYHTGVDVEYTDVTIDVPVRAAASGIVRQAGFVSGYGGVLVLQHTAKDGSPFYTLYGHLRISSLPPVGTQITTNQQVGLLGTGYSTETDGERRHLHFALIMSSTIDVRGYVQNTEELNKIWADPLLHIADAP